MYWNAFERTFQLPLATSTSIITGLLNQHSKPCCNRAYSRSTGSTVPIQPRPPSYSLTGIAQGEVYRDQPPESSTNVPPNRQGLLASGLTGANHHVDLARHSTIVTRGTSEGVQVNLGTTSNRHALSTLATPAEYAMMPASGMRR